MQQLAETLGVDERRLRELLALTVPLLDWYHREARSLPWRDDPTPYRVWVSEIMLQQTRVEAARGYFERFVAALPDIPALAAAGEDELLKLWEGLGYYSRVRNLQAAAKRVVAEHGGELPASPEALRALPGIGEYTAGAIASIAFGVPVPAPDGNVYRVLSRVLGSYAEVGPQRVKRAFAKAAALLLPADRPGDLNQALMELGATVCIPNGTPLCLHCPIAAGCAAHETGCEDELPVLPAKKPRRVEPRTLIFAVAGGRVLLERRGESGLLAGMHQPLNREGALDRAAAASVLDEMGCSVRQLTALRDAVHIFSHVEWHMRAYLARCAPPDGKPPANCLWADADALRDEIALPGAFRAYRRELLLLLESDDGEIE